MDKRGFEIDSTPCLSCPYRKDVPSGVWEESEYQKLYDYDRDTPQQPHTLFMCHKNNGTSICRGWWDCHGDQLLGMRLAIAKGLLSPSAMRSMYNDKLVPVFDSGEEAAEHGIRDIDDPSPEAIKAMRRIEGAKKRKFT